MKTSVGLSGSEWYRQDDTSTYTSEQGDDDQLRPDEEGQILFGLELQGGEEEFPLEVEVCCDPKQELIMSVFEVM